MRLCLARVHDTDMSGASMGRAVRDASEGEQVRPCRVSWVTVKTLAFAVE